MQHYRFNRAVFAVYALAGACYNRVLESPRLRVAKLMDNADFLHPVTLKSELRVRR